MQLSAGRLKLPADFLFNNENEKNIINEVSAFPFCDVPDYCGMPR